MKKTTIILLLVFIGCKSNSGFVGILTSQTPPSFWVKKIIQKGTFVNTYNQSEFNPDGTMNSYFSLNENKKGTPDGVNVDASNAEDHWLYNKQDSTLKICAVCIYKITKYTRDTIFMTDKNSPAKFVLIRHSL